MGASEEVKKKKKDMTGQLREIASNTVTTKALANLTGSLKLDKPLELSQIKMR